jgi:hypothetical protein
MKKKLYLLSTILAGTAALMLSSCLKDKSHYVNFDTGQTFVDFPKGGLSGFSAQAITEAAPDSINGVPNDNEEITRVFAVNVASQNLPTSPTTVTLAIDTSKATLDALNAAEPGIGFIALPADAFKFTGTKVTIPAGQQYANTSVTFYKALLDPAKSYVLPIVIKDGGGQKLSSNLNILYYHFIGNDFAGVYAHRLYTRHSVPDTTGSYATSDAGGPVDEGPITFFPVNPTTFQVASYYYTQLPYTVTFTKTVTGGVAMYSNWTISFQAADISYYWGTAITLGQGPSFDPNPSYFTPAFDPSASYTYAQSLKIFRFYYTTATRAIQDEYIKN